MNQDRHVAKTLNIIKKVYGTGAIMLLSNKPENTKSINIFKIEIKNIKKLFGIDGIPCGKIIEIFGHESSGKTSFALLLAKEVQVYEKVIAYIDTEHSLNLKYVKSFGIKPEQFLFSQPSYAEEAFDIIEMVIRSQTASLIIVDSVAALLPKAELEGKANELQNGLQASLLSQFLRKFNTLCIKYNTTLIFLNQIRERINSYTGNRKTTPGGYALKFYSSLRIEVNRKSFLYNSKNKITGIKLHLKTVKNKFSPPFEETFLDIMF